MTLQDKVVLITGASRGIGRALAIGFAKEGAAVVASARTVEAGTGTAEGSLEETVRQIADAGGRAVAIPCDVADEEQVKALISRALAEIGPIDVVINNAGINPVGFITEFPAAEFERALAVNVLGPFLVCKYAVPAMMERRQGSIINITSRSAIWDTEDSLIYGPSKAALDRFTLNLAVDMKPYDIAVNALGPGLVASEMTKDHDPSQDIWGRTPEPPEVMLPAATWLAQQDASTFTGRIVHRDEFGKAWP